jgi:hypothetical protein
VVPQHGPLSNHTKHEGHQLQNRISISRNTTFGWIFKAPLTLLQTQAKDRDHVYYEGPWLSSQRLYQFSNWHGLQEICRKDYLFEVGLTQIPSSIPWNIIHSLPCRNRCRLFIHDHFHKPLGLHLLVWSEFGRSRPFQPMRDLRMQWLWAFNPVCEAALRVSMVTALGTCVKQPLEGHFYTMPKHRDHRNLKSLISR